jgi:cell division protease FtsH
VKIIAWFLRPFVAAGHLLARPVAGHPRAALVAVVITASATFVLGANLQPARTGAPAGPQPSAAAGPAFTYAGTWSLIDLQRHIAAGEVVAITAATESSPNVAGSAAPTGRTGATGATGDDSDILAARLADGQVVRIALTVSPGDAVVALAGLGHGDLLTQEAWKAARTATGGPTADPSASRSDPFLSVLGVLLPVLFLGIIMTFAIRLARRGSTPSATSDRTFRTIMPVTPSEHGGSALAAELAAASTGAPAVTLADVAGCDEAKTELTETIEFLRSPEKFRRLGARIPRGVMLYGPPGTGKTMLARAVAAEAGVPFHYASGSEFVEKYVGVGAKRIRELFAQARKLGRGVIFFDEFDALGKARGGVNSHEEREQTLNQLLVELDGFGTTEDVVVIAATNRIDILDPAVLRPGRFNRKIHVGLPDVTGRREILEVHAKNKPLTVTTDLESVARKTYGFSGAQLADLLNEAAILAARRGGDAITPGDLHDGWLKVAVGTSRRRSMDERERSIIAAHEVGHAICGKIHGDKRKVEEISLFAHGEALGVTVSSQEDNDLPAESDLRARLVALMGGRAAEELLFHEVTGGASNDFEKANQLATSMVTRYGMGHDPDAGEGTLGTSGRGSLGFLVASESDPLPSEVQAAATRAIRAILDEAYAEACATLVEHVETLRRLSAYLVEHERVDGATFDELFEGTIDVPNAAREWRPATARPRAWDEVGPYAAGRRRGAASAARRSRPEADGEPITAPSRKPGAPAPIQPDGGPGLGAPAGAPSGAPSGPAGVPGGPGHGNIPVADRSPGPPRRPLVVEPRFRRVVGRAAGQVAGQAARRVRGRRVGPRASTARRVRSLAAIYLHRAGSWLVPWEHSPGPDQSDDRP